MKIKKRVREKQDVETAPVQQEYRVETVGGGKRVVLTANLDYNLPQPPYIQGLGKVMTDDQRQTLRKQNLVYTTICLQAEELRYKANVSAQLTLSGMVADRHIACDPRPVGTTTGQRWKPSQNQLEILVRLYNQGHGYPYGTILTYLTAELRKHGQIEEKNVIKWFQNKRTRERAKHRLCQPNTELVIQNDSPKEEEPKFRIRTLMEDSCSSGLPGFGLFDEL